MTRHTDVEKNFFLRTARGDEFDAYVALLAQADAVHHEHMPSHIKEPEQARPQEQDFLIWLNDPDRMLDFAVEDTAGGRNVVGLIQASVLDRQEDRAHEANRIAKVDLVVVKETHRRRGIGRALLKRARLWAEDKAVSGMALDVYAFNMIAARLYEKAGFDVLKKTYVQDFGGRYKTLTRRRSVS